MESVSDKAGAHEVERVWFDEGEGRGKGKPVFGKDPKRKRAREVVGAGGLQ
jgi:hypothetical protein